MSSSRPTSTIDVAICCIYGKLKCDPSSIIVPRVPARWQHRICCFVNIPTRNDASAPGSKWTCVFASVNRIWFIQAERLPSPDYSIKIGISVLKIASLDYFRYRQVRNVRWPLPVRYTCLSLRLPYGGIRLRNRRINSPAIKLICFGKFSSSPHVDDRHNKHEGWGLESS